MMFTDKVWQMIHHYFRERKPPSVQPSFTQRSLWLPHQSAADWWMARSMGDPYAEDENMVHRDNIPPELCIFFTRLHHAYNKNKDFFLDPDEEEFYEKYIKPFDDPLSQPGVSLVYVVNPIDYYKNSRNYFENEAPVEMFNQQFGVNVFAWSPPDRFVFHGAINKRVI